MMGSSVNKEQMADLEAWGAPEHVKEQYRQRDLGVYDENWQALGLFLRLHTQWMVDSMGHRTGLNYSGVEVAARLLDFELTADLFGQIQILEMAMIEECRKNG